MEEVIAQLRASGQFESVELVGSEVVTDTGPLFVKMGTGGADASAEVLAYEFEALRRLHDACTLIRVPKPVLSGELHGRWRTAFIAMEKVQFGPRPRGYLDALGTGLAELHAAASPDGAYGFPLDGCCGAAAQPNNADRRQMGWVEFWREFRLDEKLAALKPMYPQDDELQHVGAQVSKRLPDFFGGAGLVEADIKPVLLHGDLWSGNYSATKDGRPCIYDPASYYGHYEADHGINHMFGGGEAFSNKGYTSQLPREPGYERRAKLYELHHHLNHWQIFGQGYRSGAMSLLKALAKP